MNAECDSVCNEKSGFWGEGGGKSSTTSGTTLSRLVGNDGKSINKSCNVRKIWSRSFKFNAPANSVPHGIGPAHLVVQCRGLKGHSNAVVLKLLR